MTVIGLIGSGFLILVWMYGLLRISQQTKTIASPSGSPETEADNTSSEVRNEDEGDGLGLWGRALKPFLPKTSGLFILLLTAVTPLSIATYFLLKPKDGNLMNFGLIQI